APGDERYSSKPASCECNHRPTWFYRPWSVVHRASSVVSRYGLRTTDYGLRYTLIYDSGLSHCPISFWNFLPLSTRIWPSSPMLMPQRSSGRGAGPSKLTPEILKPLPWHGHLNFSSRSSQLGVQPRCVQVVLRA